MVLFVDEDILVGIMLIMIIVMDVDLLDNLMYILMLMNFVLVFFNFDLSLGN